MLLLGTACAPVALTPTEALGPPTYTEETATGVEHTYDGGAAFSVGGGVAVFDCNGDGKADLYLAGGAGPSSLYQNTSEVGGALRFRRVPGADLEGVNGAYPIDVDGDGNADLVVLRNGESVVLRGLGNCAFERANERWSFAPGQGNATAFSATWEGSALLPTMAVGRYLKPDTYDCDNSALLRPDTEREVYGEPIALSPGYCTLGMLFSDWDRSGRRDLRVTNDRQYYTDGQDQLWRIATGEPPRLYTDADGWVALQIWGMGIASYDLVGDGYPVVFLTSQGDNKLQTLAAGPAQPRYRDIALRRGVTAAQPFTGGEALPSTAWHAEFQDVNNDGFVDLFVAKGNVSSMPDYAQRDPSNLLLGQPDGTFKEAADTAGILNFERGRGAALVDFNLDGRLDLVEVNSGARTRLWRNVGASDDGNWLQVQVTQDGPNRDAIGAWIEVQVGTRVLRRELTIGGGHAGGQLGWTHFGVGPSGSAYVRVLWPDGEAGRWLPVATNRFYEVARGATRARPWTPN